jgi:hypothetical protein
LFNAQFQLSQAKINLMRQTGQLEDWLKTAATLSDGIPPAPVTH